MKPGVETARLAPRELSEEEFAALDLNRFRCTQCTPCCTYHAHFLYRARSSGPAA